MVSSDSLESNIFDLLDVMVYKTNKCDFNIDSTPDFEHQGTERVESDMSEGLERHGKKSKPNREKTETADIGTGVHVKRGQDWHSLCRRRGRGSG